MDALLAAARGIDALTQRIGKIVAWFVLAAVLVSAGNAVVRYTLPQFASNAFLELQWYLYSLVFMFGAAWALKDNDHVRIDIVSSRLSRKTREIIDIFGHLFFLLPFVALHVYFGWSYFTRSYAVNEVSTNAGGLLLWPAKAIIVAGFLLLGLQGLSELIKRIGLLTGHHVDVVEDTTSEHLQHEIEELVAAVQAADAPADTKKH